jgi:hypothetical protein
VLPGGEGAATVDLVGSGWNVTVASVFDEGFAGDNGAKAGGAEAGGGADVGAGAGGTATVDWVGASWEVTDTCVFDAGSGFVLHAATESVDATRKTATKTCVFRIAAFCATASVDIIGNPQATWFGSSFSPQPAFTKICRSAQRTAPLTSAPAGSFDRE